jgi:hypothetical protein
MSETMMGGAHDVYVLLICDISALSSHNPLVAICALISPREPDQNDAIHQHTHSTQQKQIQQAIVHICGDTFDSSTLQGELDYLVKISNLGKFPLLAGASFHKILELHLKVVNDMSKRLCKKDPPTYFTVLRIGNG